MRGRCELDAEADGAGEETYVMTRGGTEIEAREWNGGGPLVMPKQHIVKLERFC